MRSLCRALWLFLLLAGGCASWQPADHRWVPGPDGRPMLHAEWTVLQMERARGFEDWRAPEDDLSYVLNAAFGSGLR